MTSSYNLHRTIAFSVNAIIIALIIYLIIKSDSDKSPIIFMLFYPALTILILTIFLVLKFLKKAEAKIYKQILIGLLLLFFPIVLLISQY